YKGVVNLVTDADRRSQEMIMTRLTRAFPEHGFLAEEDGHHFSGKSDYRWLIDPLDGTTNFAHSFPIFCISIALERAGEVLIGVVYDPMRQELFRAIKGQGAWLNKRRIRVSRTNSLNRSLLATGFPYDLRESPINNLVHFENFLFRAQAIRRCGAAALDLAYVACGRFDGFWELKLNPWDIAAGSLLVTEAGGQVSDFRGQKFNLTSGEIVASNGLIHSSMIKVIALAS
ncbi:MAG: inositol monophosphatase, partial [Candidatus Aminicenantes bacterium]|nr:inositol monophosphatase [Candidatus Aminicenantes bacterium]